MNINYIYNIIWIDRGILLSVIYCILKYYNKISKKNIIIKNNKYYYFINDLFPELKFSKKKKHNNNFFFNIRSIIKKKNIIIDYISNYDKYIPARSYDYIPWYDINDPLIIYKYSKKYKVLKNSKLCSNNLNNICDGGLENNIFRILYKLYNKDYINSILNKLNKHLIKNYINTINFNPIYNNNQLLYNNSNNNSTNNNNNNQLLYNLNSCKEENKKLYNLINSQSDITLRNKLNLLEQEIQELNKKYLTQEEYNNNLDVIFDSFSKILDLSLV